MLLRPILLGLTLIASLSSYAAAPTSGTDLFNLSRIWNVTFNFSSNQWSSIKPREVQGGRFGGRPGNGAPAMGPGNFIAPGLLNALDSDHNGVLTQGEVTKTFERWAVEWDTRKSGLLNADDLRAGLNKALSQPGGPGGGGGGPGLQARAGGRNGISGASGIDFKFVEGQLTFEETDLPRVAVRYKGNGTYMDARNTEKKSLKVDINAFTKKQKIAGLSKLNFHNNITDPGWMNEPLGHQLYRDAGVPAPRTTYARVNITVPGTWTNAYFGLYSIVENPDSTWAEDRFGTKNGAIFKPVTRALFNYQGEDWSKYQQIYDPKTTLTEEQKRRVLDFSKLITQADDEELARRLPEFLEIDPFARYLAVTVWLSSTDSILTIGQNYLVYLHPKTQRFHFAPWDLDRAFGNFFFPSPEELSIREAWNSDNRFLERVMKVEGVRKAYLGAMEEFQKNIFQPTRLAAQVNALAKLLRPAIQMESSEAASRFDSVVADKPTPPTQETAQDRPQGGFGRRSPPPIKSFALARHRSVADQLAGKSQGKPLSGGPGGPGRRGGRGGPGGNFGPGNFIGPVLLTAADLDADGFINRKEMLTLGAKWFSEWDRKGTGNVTQEDLAAGLNLLLPRPNFGTEGR